MKPGTRGRLFLLIVFIASISFTAKSQVAAKANPVIYIQAFYGPAWDNFDYLLGAAVSHQVKRHLFTTRYVYALEQREYPPSDLDETTLHEVSLLYGWRFIDKGMSYSLSLGGSYNWHATSSRRRYQTTTKSSRCLGVPFEANALLFKARRKPFRVLGLIPVGKPTGFGRSIGVKVAGNFSKHSYAGVGLSYGLGWHQRYPTE